MLKKINRSELREGLIFSAPVFFDDGENMLLSQGMPFKKRELAALDRWKISFVLSAGRAISAAEAKALAQAAVNDDDLEEIEEIEEVDSLDEAEALDELESDEGGAPVSANPLAETAGLDKLQYTTEQILKLPEVLAHTELYAKYHGLIRDLDTVFLAIQSRGEVRTRSIDRIVSELFVLIQTERSEVVGYILGGDVKEMQSAKCAVNTAILSIIIGEHIGLPRHRLLQIATGALLHDIGMIKVPVSIINKETKLDDNELQIIRSHTSYGYKLIVNELLYADEVGKAAMQHHERWDGEGYPGRLAGDKIDIGARIVSVADAFEAMVSPKAYRDSMVGYQAMKNLLSDNARRFDPDIIRAMIQSMGIYPVGSIVLLNNSAIARVIQSHQDAPLRPVIRVLIDEFGNPFMMNEGETVDLIDNRNLFIARAIDPSEYQKES